MSAMLEEVGPPGLSDASPETNIPLYITGSTALSGPDLHPKLYNGKNRTFFLFAFGGIQQTGGQPVLFLNVPTDTMKNGNFAFGANALDDLQSEHDRQNAAGAWISDPSRAIRFRQPDQPVVKNFLSHNPWVEPNTPESILRPAPAEFSTISQPKHLQRYATDVKIDHQFSTKHKIFARFSEMTEPVWL